MSGLARASKGLKVSKSKTLGHNRVSSKAAVASFPRITRTPGIMGGKPCIKGSRITVGMLVGQIGDGATIDELLEDFPELKREDILQAIGYAGWFASGMLIDLGTAA